MKSNYKRMKQRRRAEAKAARAELAARAAAKTHESTVAEVVDMAEARCDAMTAWAQGTSGIPATGTMELEEAARYSLRCRKASLEELDGNASGFGLELVVDPATMETSWRPLAAGALFPPAAKAGPESLEAEGTEMTEADAVSDGRNESSGRLCGRGVYVTPNRYRTHPETNEAGHVRDAMTDDLGAMTLAGLGLLGLCALVALATMIF